jgi:hypothetical protein
MNKENPNSVAGTPFITRKWTINLDEDLCGIHESRTSPKKYKLLLSLI